MRSFKAAVFLCVACLLVACGNSDGTTGKNDVTSGKNIPKKERVKSAKSINAAKKRGISVEKFLDELHAQYRLQLDRRFLEAISVVYQFYTNQRPEKIESEFVNGSWIVRCQGEKLATLREYPDFSDFVGVLQRVARRLQGRNPGVLADDGHFVREPELEMLLANYLAEGGFSVLRRIDQQWKKSPRDKQSLAYAARAMTRVALNCPDFVDIADDLWAKALALLAISRSVGINDEGVLVDEALLAADMGYGASARKITESLPVNHPATLYLLGNSEELKRVAEQDYDPMARYLYLIYLATKGNYEEWGQWLLQEYKDNLDSLSILQTCLILDQFSTDRYFAEILPGMVYYKLMAEGQKPSDVDLAALVFATMTSPEQTESNPALLALRKALGLSKAGMLSRFHEELKKLNNRYEGNFLTAFTIGNFYESYYYSCLYTQGLFYLDSLSSQEMVKIFSQEISGANASRAKAFERWYTNLAASKLGKVGKTELVQMAKDLTELPDVGFWPLRRTFYELKQHYNFGEFAFFASIKHLVQRMDTRPSHRKTLGSIAKNSLMNLPLADKLFASVLRDNPDSWNAVRIWFAYFNDNFNELQKLAFSNSLDPDNRAYALRLLKDNKDMQNVVLRGYENLVSDYPRDYYINKSYVDYLLDNKRYPEARKAALAWLDLDVPTAGLEMTVMRNSVGQSYLEAKQFKEGLTYIRPFIEGRHARSMLIGAKCMAGLGQFQDAETLFQQTLQRYPDSLHILLDYAAFLWKQQRYKEAAKLIIEWPYPKTPEIWHTYISTKFAETFADRPEEESKAAFKALLQAGGNPYFLLAIPGAFSRHENFALAFALGSQLKPRDMSYFEILAKTYTFKKKADGRQAAFEWLDDEIPRGTLNIASMFFFSVKEDDLLWEMNRKPEKSDGGDYIWLLRAAAWCRQGSKITDSHYQELLDYFNNNDRTFYQKIGSYLLGVSPLDDALALIYSRKERCELAYFIGLENHAKGDLAEASNWYHIALQTGSSQNGEYRWALDEIYRWYARDKSLRVIAKSE